MRHPVCPCVQFRVAHLPAFVLYRDRFRRAANLGLEQAVDRRCIRISRRRLVPRLQQPYALVLVQQRDPAHLLAVVLHHRRQQPLQVAQVAFDRFPIEQRRRVVQRAGEAFRCFPQFQRQVELGCGLPGAHTFDRQAIQFQAQPHRFGVQPRQCGLEHRAVRQAAHRPHPLHYLLEWQVLVGLGFQHLRLHSAQQLRYRRAADLHSQCQRVHEEADQPLHFAARAVRYRRAHHHLILARQATQQCRPACQYRHEQRCSVSLTQLSQPCAKRLVEYHFDRAARVVLLRRPRTIGRQAQQRWGAGQRLFPVRALPLQFPALQPAALPDCVVRVLDRQGRQRISVACTVGLVQRAQLPRQHPLRPAIRHDVVHRDQQDVFLLAQLYQAASDQWALLQVERGSRLRLGQQAELVL
ncbi:hypothetical protein GO290_05160 [Ralstonia solanacearum]|nr:hypothetical protein [Ralstonia solanacearum]NKA76285.1 hypothetical protein [Ralstonia solanacearum]NKF82676.1 hypothetical protein [Ralstonia solanacearum]NKF87696.1 hypothetical protein [Ralstonia solanacearum]NKF98036.1 hypothetical protein [Ralstonia solanacearum]